MRPEPAELTAVFTGDLDVRVQWERTVFKDSSISCHVEKKKKIDRPQVCQVTSQVNTQQARRGSTIVKAR